MRASLEIKWLQLIQVELSGTKYLVFNRILLLKRCFHTSSSLWTRSAPDDLSMVSSSSDRMKINIT